jgi:hypothetical protein
MERKLSNAQSRAIMALVQERDKFVRQINADIDELVSGWAGDRFREPKLDGRPDGIYIIEKAGSMDADPQGS